MESKAAPTGANLQHVIFFAKLELLANAVKLRNRSFMKRAFSSRKDRTGIGKSLIEEEREEIVSKIVVCSDVAATPRKCIASHAVSRSTEKIKKPGSTALDSAENIRIAAENAHQGNKVVATPKSLDVSFCSPKAAAENHIAKKPRIANFNRCRKRGFPRISKYAALSALDTNQPAVPQFLHSAPEQIAYKTWKE